MSTLLEGERERERERWITGKDLPMTIYSLLDMKCPLAGVRNVIGCHKFSVPRAGQDSTWNIS